MKTPEEIKMGLECCTHATCNGCPYAQDGCATNREMIDALDYIQQLEAQVTKWISVDERPPELPCICYDGENLPHEAKQIHTLSSLKWTRYFSYDPFEFLEMMQQACDSDETIDIGSMTHILFWMPLPEPPKYDGHD